MFKAHEMRENRRLKTEQRQGPRVTETKRNATPDKSSGSIDRLAEHLELQLMREIGPILVGESLRRALGYRSMAALRQAIKRRTIPIPVFPIENRRGKCALSHDVARWLAEKRAAIGFPSDGTKQD